MMNLAMRLFGKRALNKVAHNHVKEGGMFDIRLGFALLRDRRVSLGTKLLALASGAGLTALLVSLELPLDSIVAAMLPIVGFAIDLAVDGLEVLICPVLAAVLLLPMLAAKPLVEQIRGERGGQVIDVEPMEAPSRGRFAMK